MLPNLFRPEREPCPEPEARWFQLKVGDFKLEAGKKEMLAFWTGMRLAMPVVVTSAALLIGTGAANMETKLCDQPGNPAAPVVEELRPHK